MDESDTSKALNLLIHDVRAPLSVAQGYVRLLQQNRLASADERTRALSQTMDALGRIGRMCDDAAAYAAGPSPARLPAARVELGELIALVSQGCAMRCPGKLEFVLPSRVTGVILTPAIDRTSEALAVVLCAVRRSATDSSVRVAVVEDHNTAQFLLGGDDDRAALVARPPEMFDPWRGGHGIALPLACRTIHEAGGRIWTVADSRGAVGIAFPEEASDP